ncbi:hypothetical protein PMKS-002685 [Pichia membranifaciens]|uniref:Phosphoribosyltransferase domain-containing protein n=1 Tax=Pichia membranifaciens TaxID=4926 RepID=A0A1Q2YIL0_9ASCO|nr:hypothetical protein PMKS-002685 [Pichia membranifaciens]
MLPVFKQVVPLKSYTPDIFEYVYFARPDSVLDGISVYRSRLLMGEKLAQNITDYYKSQDKDVLNEIDVVIPVPDTSRHSALQRKLNAMASEFYGKSVLLVDDSIVRGTTSQEIVNMAREAGAKKVFFASCSPVIRYNHIYGIDLADNKQLVGFNRTENEISLKIGADHVFYQNLEDLIDCCKRDDSLKDHERELALTPVVSRDNSIVSMIARNDDAPRITGFEAGVFTGKYVTGDETNYMLRAEQARARNERRSDSGSTGMDILDVKAPSEINIFNSGDY